MPRCRIARSSAFPRSERRRLSFCKRWWSDAATGNTFNRAPGLFGSDQPESFSATTNIYGAFRSPGCGSSTCINNLRAGTSELAPRKMHGILLSRRAIETDVAEDRRQRIEDRGSRVRQGRREKREAVRTHRQFRSSSEEMDQKGHAELFQSLI